MASMNWRIGRVTIIEMPNAITAASASATARLDQVVADDGVHALRALDAVAQDEQAAEEALRRPVVAVELRREEVVLPVVQAHHRRARRRRR